MRSKDKKYKASLLLQIKIINYANISKIYHCNPKLLIYMITNFMKKKYYLSRFAKGEPIDKARAAT